MSLEDERRKMVAAIEQAKRDIQSAQDRVDEAKRVRDSRMANLNRLWREQEEIENQIRARDWKPNATIASDLGDPDDYGFTLLFRSGERVQVTPQGGVIKADGRIFYGEPELETDP